MAQIRVVLDGGQEVLHKVDAYDRELVSDLENIVKKYANKTAKTARAKAPVGPTGNLSRSFKAKDVSKKIGIPDRLAKTVTARGGRGWHLHLVELGTAARMQRSTGRSVGTMPASPFMGAVEQANAGAYNSEIEARILRKKVI